MNKYHANTNKSTTVCTRCGAQPGERCRTKSGRIASQWHDNREVSEYFRQKYAAMTPEERAEQRAKMQAIRERVERMRKPVAVQPNPSLIQRVVAFFKKVA